MRIFFYKIGLFLIIIYGITFVIFWRLNTIFNNEFIICDKPSWAQNIKQKNLDFAVLGSSRALNVIDNKLIDDCFGTKSINIATSGGGFAENYICLYLFLKNENTTKSLWLQVDGSSINNIGFHRAFNEQYYMHLMQDDMISGVIKEQVNPLKFFCWKYIPITRYMEFNFRYSAYKALKGGYSCVNLDYDVFNGYEPLNDTLKIDSIKTIDKFNFVFNPKEMFYLYKIIALCEQKKIRIVMFNSPEYIHYLNAQVNKDSLDNFYASLACKHNSVYFSNLKFNLINSNFYFFKDLTHLNKNGAKKYSLELAKCIYHEKIPKYD